MKSGVPPKRAPLLQQLQGGGTTESAEDGSGSPRSVGSSSGLSPKSPDDLPVMFRDKLDVNNSKDKVKVARRLSSSRRISIVSASQSIFPQALRERFKIRDLLGR